VDRVRQKCNGNGQSQPLEIVVVGMQSRRFTGVIAWTQSCDKLEELGFTVRRMNGHKVRIRDICYAGADSNSGDFDLGYDS
jgi:hypothetical protein